EFRSESRGTYLLLRNYLPDVPACWSVALFAIALARQEKTLAAKQISLLRPVLEQQAAVRPAEPEGIGKHVLKLGFARLVGNVIEVAFGIGIFEVCGRRNHLIAQREHANAGFQAAGAAQQMTGHGLGGADSDLLRMLAESALDGLGF